jgi:hypothetical protein
LLLLEFLSFKKTYANAVLIRIDRHLHNNGMDIRYIAATKKYIFSESENLFLKNIRQPLRNYCIINKKPKWCKIILGRMLNSMVFILCPKTFTLFYNLIQKP